MQNIQQNKLEEYKAWKAIGLQAYPYADFSRYGTIFREGDIDYEEKFLKELGLTYTKKERNIQ